MKKSILPRV